jgi:class 3 adenylate cyclase
VHTGEVELRGDDVAGIVVHIAARVAALAGAGELLASRTVRDLGASSDYAFSSRGLHSLKGVPEEWELLAVT